MVRSLLFLLFSSQFFPFVMFALQGTQIRSNISVCRCFPLLHWMWYVRHMTRSQKPNTSTHQRTHTNSNTLNRSGLFYIQYGPNIGIADEIWNGTLCVCSLCTNVFQSRDVHSCMHDIEWKWSRMWKREHRKKNSKHRKRKRNWGVAMLLCFGMKQTWNGNQ